jgi:large subunit ribosomal protein L10
MPKPEKEAKVAELSDKLRSAQSVILADFSGLDVEAVTELRSKMRTAGIEYQVVKNTLALRAARAVGFEALKKLLTGPTAIAFGPSDLSAPAKILVDFAKVRQLPKIKGGIWEGKLLEAKEVAAIAALPGKEILKAQLLSTMLGPMTNLSSLIAAAPRQFLATLAALSEKKKNESG